MLMQKHNIALSKETSSTSDGYTVEYKENNTNVLKKLLEEYLFHKGLELYSSCFLTLWLFQVAVYNFKPLWTKIFL